MTFSKRLVAGAALVASCVSAAACVAVLGLEDVTYGPGGADAKDDRADAAGDAPPAPSACDASYYDLQGCSCDASSRRQCWHGVPVFEVDASVCVSSGTQDCNGGRWSSCNGGSLPDAEICGNGKDDNCNGVVDDGCDAGLDARDGGGPG